METMRVGGAAPRGRPSAREAAGSRHAPRTAASATHVTTRRTRWHPRATGLIRDLPIGWTPINRLHTGPTAQRYQGIRKTTTEAREIVDERQPRRMRSQRKNGPPMIAVRMPTGSTIGAIRVRAATSQTTRKAAPNSVEAGSTSR